MATTEILLPLMGEGVNEATVSNWLVKEGDPVKKDAPLLEVSTDKVDTEIPAPADGVLLKIQTPEGTTVEVNQVLGVIGDSASDSATIAANTTTPPEVTKTHTSPQGEPPKMAPATVNNAPGVRSSPLVRKIAAEKGIDLSQVAGSGLHGRITKRDVLNVSPVVTTGGQASHIHTEAPATPSSSLVTRSSSPTSSPSLNLSKDADGKEYLEGVEVQREAMSRMRKLIADHMVDSVRTSPHVTTVFEIDMHKVVQLREQSKSEFQRTEGFKLTYTPFILQAAAEAIKKHPIVNTSLDGNDILYKKDINLGCAVAINGGLIVPVIKKAGELSLLGISRRLNDLVERARSKKLKPDEVQGGTFSVTNPGGFGSLTSNPIINQPQVAILGIGTIVKRPVVVDNDMIAIRPQMLASLTFDHRVIDGEGGAKFLATFKKILEDFQDSPI